MRITSESLELGYQLAEEATPAACVCCYHPGMIGVTLAQRVIDGDMGEIEAVTELRTDIERNCPKGILRHEDVCIGNGTECRYDEELQVF